ncbi:MAG: hypothetical protein NZ805_06110 [Armatimonadetes bacterium]|nr:hypothetical protein [Armatimonadota bacterium]MDW8027686.1 hypothetical protein [Armatimonadota bacterium]
MARRRKVIIQPKEQQVKEPKVPLWLQIFISLWMIGVLIGFFSDYKIQQWLAMMFADLFGQ